MAVVEVGEMGLNSLFMLSTVISTVMAAEEEPNECSLNFKGSCYDKIDAMYLKIIVIFVICYGYQRLCFRVILATSFVHVLPDTVECLESTYLPGNPWHKFPFSTFMAMVSAVGTLMMNYFSMAVHHWNYRERSDVHASPSLYIHGREHDHSLTLSGKLTNKGDQLSSNLERNQAIALPRTTPRTAPLLNFIFFPQFL